MKRDYLEILANPALLVT